MTTDKANQFVTEVLRGLWEGWEPHDTQIREWVVRLLRFDYDRAEKAVKDLYFDTAYRKSPPANKVMAALYSKAAIKRTTEQGGPVCIFSVIRERHFRDDSKPNFIFAKHFCVGSERMVPAREEIVQRAEATRRRMIDFYRHRYIIIYPKLEGKDSDGENS